MSRVNERIERLIVRRLDGELTADEQLELDRELMRSPEARDLLDSYQQIDEAASAALVEAVGTDNELSVALADLPATVPARSTRHGRAWWALPAAVAAAVSVLVVLYTPQPPGPTLTERKAPAPRPRAQPARHVQPGDAGVYRANFDTRNLSRSTNQSRLFIQGKDGNLYVIEQRHTRTARQPISNAGLRRVSGDL